MHCNRMIMKVNRSTSKCTDRDSTFRSAIIQLSVDSIHVVKPSDTRFAVSERRSSRKWRFDFRSSRTSKKISMIMRRKIFFWHYWIRSIVQRDHRDPWRKNKPSNKLIEMIFHRLTIVHPAHRDPTVRHPPHLPFVLFLRHYTSMNSKDSSSSFVRSLTNCFPRSIAIPCVQTVMIINDHFEPLELYSLSGTTVQFYSSFFTQKLLPAHGGNTTLRVYFLPRTLGITKSTFTIQTSHGTFQYYVNSFDHLQRWRTKVSPRSMALEKRIRFVYARWSVRRSHWIQRSNTASIFTIRTIIRSRSKRFIPVMKIFFWTSRRRTTADNGISKLFKRNQSWKSLISLGS